MSWRSRSRGRRESRRSSTGTVTVSYHPVTDDLTKMIPRYASGPTNDVITIEDCTTTLLFPFVTNQVRLQYRTGHHECLGGSWLLHHRVQRRSRCS